MNTGMLSPKERLEFLRAEDIRARFVLYTHTTFAQNCREHWTGFHWHAHRNYLPGELIPLDNHGLLSYIWCARR